MKLIIRATVVACIVALLGGGIATASSLITGSQVKDSSLTGRDIKNRSLTPADFSGSVTGPQGARGLQGAAGAPGAQGPAGIANVTPVRGADVAIAPGQVGGAVASCPAGSVVTGTGFFASIGRAGFATNYGTYVGIGVYNDTSIVLTVHAEGTCAALSGGGVRAVTRSSTAPFEQDVAALRAAR